MKRSPKNRMILILVFTVLIGALEIIFVTIPSIKEIKQTKEEIVGQIDYANKLLLAGQTINRLQADIKRITPFLDKFNQIFIRPEEQLSFIISLEDLAKNKGVTAELSISDLPKGPKEETVSVPLDMRVQSSFPELVAFLIELQKLDYYINIKTISLNSGGANGENISSILRSTTYWQATSTKE